MMSPEEGSFDTLLFTPLQ